VVSKARRTGDHSHDAVIANRVGARERRRHVAFRQMVCTDPTVVVFDGGAFAGVEHCQNLGAPDE
jgi:hypothetical protein